MDTLPPHLKHKILSFDPALLSAAYGDVAKKEEKGEKDTIGETTPYPSLTLHNPSQLHKFTPSLLSSLGTQGYIVLDNFLGYDTLIRCKADAIALHEGGDLRPAKMNKGDEQWKQQEIRGDAIKWLDRTDAELRARFPALWCVLDAQDALRAELDAACDFKSNRIQVQVARYPAGTRYVRHRDAFVGSSEPSRRITAIYYLNESWKKEDGGYLRMFLQGGETKDVEPIGDRLLLFWSAHVDHEVLLSNNTRFAVTMWFY